MKRRLPAAIVAASIFLIFFSSLVGTASAAPVLTDDFDDNETDTDMWIADTGGSGPEIDETNGRVEVFFPAASANDPLTGAFGGGYTSKCIVRGDFDVQVDYDTVVWPSGNGVRLGLATLGASQLAGGIAERVSFGASDVSYRGRDVYLTHFSSDGVRGIVNTTHRSGKLRLARTGSQLTGYYFDEGGWVPIHSGSTATADILVQLATWSHNRHFTDQDVRVAFDNFVVNQGELICPVPLFKQDDPGWGDLEYDHGNSQTLFCGTTIAQCGCATTSIAMVLKHHGVDKAPNGDPTTPKSVNEYFKKDEECGVGGCASLGYSYGNVLWTKVNQYSKEANENFGTQKIIFNGGGPYNPSTVTDDLNSDNPVILKSPVASHWFVATGIDGSTFTINDPLFDRTRLSDAPYNNNAELIRRYKKTASDFSTFEVVAKAPAQILITDPDGNTTGFDASSNSTVQDIPNSFYFFDEALEDDTGANPPPPAGAGVYTAIVTTPIAGNYTIEVIAPENELYSFAVYGADRDAELKFDLFEGTPAPGESHDYAFSYDPEPGENKLALQVPIDIRPHAKKNRIFCRRWHRIIRVALLSTETFDATTVDHTTVEFEGAREAFVRRRTGEPRRRERDVTHDGRKDLVFRFRLRDTDLTCDSTEGRLTGKTFDGLDIEGVDVIYMVDRHGRR